MLGSHRNCAVFCISFVPINCTACPAAVGALCDMLLKFSLCATQVDAVKERFTVTLKQSLVGASDAAYLQSLFHDLEFAEKLRCVKCPIQSPLHLDADSSSPLCVLTL